MFLVLLVINNFKQGQGYSAKADIWSLGCVCLEMFAGRRPWSDDEAIQAMFKVCNVVAYDVQSWF